MLRSTARRRTACAGSRSHGSRARPCVPSSRHHHAPADTVGSVTGVAAAAGGLGGFLPPLVMGSLHGAHGSYALGLVLLALAAAAALAFTGTGARRATAPAA